MPRTRDVVLPRSPEPSPLRGPAHDSARALHRLSAAMDSLKDQSKHMRVSVTRLHDAMAPRIARAAAMRDADARSEARALRSTPAVINAANRARWGRA